MDEQENKKIKENIKFALESTFVIDKKIEDIEKKLDRAYKTLNTIQEGGITNG